MTKESNLWLRHLYNEDLYVIAKKPDKESLPTEAPKIGRKGVLVLYQMEDGTALSEPLKAFLTKILNAVGLKENNTKILPITQVPNPNDTWFEKVICFGQWPELPDNLDNSSYTIQQKGGTQYLKADVLDKIEKKVELKKKLWDNLKAIFKA